MLRIRYFIQRVCNGFFFIIDWNYNRNRQTQVTVPSNNFDTIRQDIIN